MPIYSLAVRLAMLLPLSLACHHAVRSVDDGLGLPMLVRDIHQKLVIIASATTDSARVLTAIQVGPADMSQDRTIHTPQATGGEETMKDSTASQARAPKNNADLRFWLEDMSWYHRYSLDEMSATTGLAPRRIEQALRRLKLNASSRPHRSPGLPLTVLPYPGGRHPRIGFLEGAVNPQRDTKISVFAPWDEESYAVVDLPEAIWSNLGLIYLAHTHVPTIWSAHAIELVKREWERRTDGSWAGTRTLPNGVEFGANVIPETDGVKMEIWLKNHSAEMLSDLRVQNCVLLKGMRGFTAQTNDNKRFESPFVACHSEDGRRWIITAWERCSHAWGNAQCPCLHSDPKFPDCGRGRTARLRGWLSFYEGTDIEGEIHRLKDMLHLAE